MRTSNCSCSRTLVRCVAAPFSLVLAAAHCVPEVTTRVEPLAMAGASQGGSAANNAGSGVGSPPVTAEGASITAVVPGAAVPSAGVPSAGAGGAGAGGSAGMGSGGSSGSGELPAPPCGESGAACCDAIAPCRAGLVCAGGDADAGARRCVPCASLRGLGFADPGANPPSSEAAAISTDGRVIVGSSRLVASDGSSTDTAVRWQNGQLVAIGTPGAVSYLGSGAAAVSSDGSVVLINGTLPTGNVPLIWRSAQPNVVQTLSAADPTNKAYGLSGDGRVAVGTVFVPEALPDPASKACLWRLSPNGNGFTSDFTVPGLDAVAAYGATADGSLLVGEMNSDESGGGFAFIWNGATGGLSRLPPSRTFTGATAHAVNASGTVVVGFDGGPLLWRSASPLPEVGSEPELLDPGSGDTSPYGAALATNADGTVVVGGDGIAFVWRPREGIRSLAEALSAAGIAVQEQWQRLESATGVSGDGRIIVGFGSHEGGVREGFVATLGDLLCASR